LRLADSDDRRIGPSPETEDSHQVDELCVKIREARRVAGDSPSIYVEDAGIAACRSSEETHHLAIGREEAHSDHVDAAGDLKRQYSSIDTCDELSRSAEHPTVTGQEVLNPTLVTVL
jgi:hypothetical protein